MTSAGKSHPASPGRCRRMTEVAIALGGNVPHGRYGRPKQVLKAAVAALEAAGLRILRLSPIIETAPLGPSRRRYANAVLRAFWPESAESLLALLKGQERAFGRRRGQRWGARVLDCDLLVFGAARISAPGLEVPHPRLHQRDFVLQPFDAVWPDWRHPLRQQTVQQMRHRLLRRRAVD